MRNKKLTLIELIIVILVLGLLVGLAIPQFTGVKANADVSSLKNDLDVLSAAITEQYVKEDTLPLGDALVLPEGDLKDYILARGDDATKLFKVDLSKTEKYHNKLKSKVDADNYFIYSTKTGNVYHSTGRINSDDKVVFGIKEFPFITLMGGKPLSSESINVSEVTSITLSGKMNPGDAVSVTLNDVTQTVTTGDIPFIKNLQAGSNTYSVNLTILDDTINKVVVKISKDEETYKILVGELPNTPGEETPPMDVEPTTKLGEKITFPSISGTSPLNVGTTTNTMISPNNTFLFVGNWPNSGTLVNPYTNEINATVVIPFTGTGIDVEFYTSSVPTDVEVWIDNKQYPSLNLYQSSDLYWYQNIAKNLPSGQHELKLINKKATHLRFRNIKIYNTPTAVKPLVMTGIIDNASNKLLINYENGLGIDKLLIYKSLEPNIDINSATVYDIVDKNDLTTSTNTLIVSNKINYIDTNSNNSKTYYYKVVGIENGNYARISNELTITPQPQLIYNNLTLNERYKLQLDGAWTYNTTTAPRTSISGDSVTFKFDGTGASIELAYFNSRSGLVEVWVDGVQYPSLSLVVGWYEEAYQYHNIVRNLPSGVHTVKLINKDNKQMTIRGINIFTTPTVVSPLAITGSIDNGANKIRFAKDFGVKEYKLFRGTSPNIDITSAAPYDVIDKDELLKNTNITQADSYFYYFDKNTNHTTTYYYKLVGYDGGNNARISNEVTISPPTQLIYNNLTLNERYKLQLDGAWTYTTSVYPRTSVSGDSVTFKFDGTGASIELAYFNSRSGLVEVWVDGVQYPSLSLVVGWYEETYQYHNIVRNLPSGVHTVKLINKDNKQMAIRGINIFTTPTIASPLAITGSIDNGANKIRFAKDFGVKEYKLFRGTSPNIDITSAVPYDVIDKDELQKSSNITQADSYFYYFDKNTNHTTTYYYKLVGYDGGNNARISNELTIVPLTQIVYDNLTLNERYKPQLSGTWTQTNTIYPKTSISGSSATFKFDGTGSSIELYNGSGYSASVEVWVDEVQYTSLNLNVSSNAYVYRDIVRNLPTGLHTVRLVNKESKPMVIRFIHAITN